MLLENITKPADLKKLSVEQLEQLAAEVRTFLIEKVSVTGGHLAPNLGVVELTVAIHYMLNSPEDKLIFDVGHQSYVHKMLTGRMDQFDSLRKYKGLCGYVKSAESEHDLWEAGHSSTSLSAAMGMAISRDLQGESNRVVAMIGDGAMTGGMALEALNHIGHEQKKMIVVLNDNEMSIAPNVGAIHNYLCKIRAGKPYNKAKEEIEHLLKKIPAIGSTLAKTAERVKDSLKYLVVPGIWFEELGFTYFGPVDGHDLPTLLDTLQQADKVDGPVLLHVLTVKGKGYAPAEENSDTWHGISPYKIESGKVIKAVAPPSYTEIFEETLIELAETDDRIVVVTPAMPIGSGVTKFAKQFPGRMIDVGIAEQHAATMSGAMAATGMKPVFAVYSTFLQRAYDQVVHDICRQKLNVVFAIDRAGFVGADGETHQGVYDIAFLRHIPNIVIMMPKDENELRHMLKTALDYNEGPIAVRYPRQSGRGVERESTMQVLPIGSWQEERPGQTACVLAVGPMVEAAEAASDDLRKDGITLRVVNARFIKPLDEAMLLSLAEENIPLITVEEGSRLGGFGSSVGEFYVDQGNSNIQLSCLAIPDYYVEHGSQKEQREEVGLTSEAIVKKVRSLLPDRKRQRA